MQNRLNRWWSRLWLICAMWGGIALPGYAVEPFIVKEIRLEGLQRVEAGTVYATLPFRTGDTYTDEKGSLSIRNLFGLGLFKDVRIQVNNHVVVVSLEERPTINTVSFVGNKVVETDNLMNMMKEIGLIDGRPFDKGLADKAEQEIRRQYLSRSFFSTRIVLTTTPVEKNRVNLTIAITEGEVAKIVDVSFIGNKAFSAATLAGEMSLNTGTWWSWYSKSNRYSKAKLNADIEALRAFYLSRGYVEFSIDPPKVDISPAQDEIRITISLYEGNQYQVSGVRIEGNTLGKEQDLKSLITVDVGKPYDAEKANESTRSMQKALGNFGYAFAKVEVVPLLDKNASTVALSFNVEPGVRAYVRRINISGNTKTRDEVIRREFRQLEASWYDGERIRASRDRVDRLGFFTEVQIDTQEVPGSPDQVDINLSVVEKPTANISFGMGYSSSDKLTFQAGLRQENIFGSGHYVGVNIDTSKLNRQLSIATTDPYYTKDGVSRTFEAYYKTSRPTSAKDTDYRLINQGLGLRFGVPITDNDVVFVGATYDHLSVIDGTNLPQTHKDFVARVGSESYTVPLTVGWSNDSRDSALAPNNGSFKRLSLDMNAVGQSRYLKASGQYQLFIPLSRQVTFAVNSQMDWGKGLGGNGYPFFKNVYAGGLGSVRGFQANSLGPVDSDSKLAIGGSKAAFANFEFLAPFPGTGKDRTLRMYTFLDVGGVFGEGQAFGFNDMRSSAGVGISWLSPVGPLRLSYAKPIKKTDTDKLEKIQFQIGAAF